MHSHELERRLRLPAPDEPAILPALVLPTFDGGFGAARGSVRLGRQSRAILGAPPLAFALLALLIAMIGAIAIGALRLDRLPNPFDPNAGFLGRGVTLDYPKDWEVVAATDPLNDRGSFTALIVSNVGVTGCAESDLGPAATPPSVTSDGTTEYVGVGDPAPLEDRIFECVIEKPMAAGEIRLVLSLGYPQKAGVGPYEPIDATAWFGPNANTDGGSLYVPTEADGWTQIIDGMPAKVVAETTSIVPGADEVRTWGIYPPGGFLGIWYVRSTLRGPDLETLRAQADTVARSLRFDKKSPPLDEARRDEALTRVIDALDRETREFRGSDFYGCFPRSPGERATLIDDRLYEYGPDGPLAKPVPVTCTTTVEPTPLGLWHATLVVSWDGGEGYKAGEWGWQLFFDAEGIGAASGQLAEGGKSVYPGTLGELPPPLDGPLVVPIGAIVEVLPPGIEQSGAPIQSISQNPNATIGDRVLFDASPGSRFRVVEGPIAHEGFDWYLVERWHGTSQFSEFAWVPASDGERPLIKVVQPDCLTGAVDVVTLLDLIPPDRLACFGSNELRLDPTMLGRIEQDPGGSVGGVPDWLAKDPELKLYGRAGATGLDGAIPVHISPTLGDRPPTGTWLTVRGHFDDPAAATCEMNYPEGWGSVREPDHQVRACRERFVITAFETREAP